MALSEYYRINRSSLSIRFSGINAVVCFYFFLGFYKICAIRHKNPPTDEIVGGFAAGRSPHKCFKFSDKDCVMSFCPNFILLKYNGPRLVHIDTVVYSLPKSMNKTFSLGFL